MKKTLQDVLLASLTVLLFACEGEEGKRGLPAPVLIGSITGSVTTAIKGDIVGIEVKIAETSQKTFADSLGNWTINDISAGIYTLEFSRAGYGTSKIMNYQFVGGGTSRVGSSPTLTKIPEYTANTIELINVPNDEQGQLSFIVTFMPQAPRGEPRLFRLYFSKDKNFTPSGSNFFYTTTIPGNNLLDSYSELTIRVSGIAANLKSKSPTSTMLPFVKGDTVYVTTCASTSAGSAPVGSGYYDYEHLGQFVFTDITAPANTLSFVIP